MAVTDIKRDQGLNVNIVRLTVTDTLAQVAANGYVTAQDNNITAINNGEWTWLSSDSILVYASDGHQFFEFQNEDFSTFVPVAEGENVILPVVAGNFAVFANTTGTIEDTGYSPSDSSKTKVVMANSPVTDGGLTVFSDNDGTITAAIPATHLVESDDDAPTSDFALTVSLEMNAPNIDTTGSAIASRNNISCTVVTEGLLAAQANQVTILGDVEVDARLYCSYNIFDLASATIDEAQVSVIYASFGDAPILVPTDLTKTRGITIENGTGQDVNAMLHTDGPATNLMELNNGAGLTSFFQIAGVGAGAPGNAIYQPAVRALQLVIDGTNYWIGLYDSNT